MIRPKLPPLTLAEERAAYAVATGRDEGKCVRCHRGHDVQRDHRRNRSQGGRTTAANLQLLCATCHAWKTEHPRLADDDGYACPGFADPAEWPAARWLPTARGTVRAAWVLYDDLGGWTEISVAEVVRRREGVA